MKVLTAAAKSGDIKKAKADALVLLFVENELELSGTRAFADRLTHAALSRCLEEGFKGKKDEVEKIPAGKGSPFARVVLVGLGEREKLEVENWRRAGGLIVSALDKGKNLTACVELFDPGKAGLELAELAQALVEGAMARNYRFIAYKSKNGKPGPLSRLHVYGKSPAINKGVERGLVYGECQAYARDLQNRPAAELTPELFAREAQRAGKAHGLKVKVFREAELKKMGMRAILAVGQGSHNPPRLVTVSYKGARRNSLDLALVGKGVTFDSGGISIKPSSKMDEMKSDMAGAAVCLAAVLAAARLGLKVNVTAVLPLAENMPGGGAQRPGDIIKTASGITVEVKNTDAEGRLILADALHYAGRLKPKTGIIDAATLTGACAIAVGSHAIALMGNNEELLSRIGSAALATGERTWLLPLWDEYEELIESEVADILNTSTRREAGTIVGGMFLKRFVKDLPWAHLDIASVTWTPKSGPYLAAGPSGKGARLLLRVLESLSG